MKLYKGQRVKVKTYKSRPGRWNTDGLIDKYMNQVVTIATINGSRISIKEDIDWVWTKDDFEAVFLLPEELFEI